MRCYNAIELIKITKWEITIMSTEEIKEYIGTQLKALTSIASPTGFTKNATDYLMTVSYTHLTLPTTERV